MSNNNLLSCKKFSDQHSGYKPFYTTWMDDKEADLIKTFFISNMQVQGFYQYTLTMKEQGPVTFECCHCDLREYIQYLQQHKIQSVYNEENNANIIEQ